jgi:hypothetical protein
MTTAAANDNLIIRQPENCFHLYRRRGRHTMELDLLCGGPRTQLRETEYSKPQSRQWLLLMLPHFEWYVSPLEIASHIWTSKHSRHWIIRGCSTRWIQERR